MGTSGKSHYYEVLTQRQLALMGSNDEDAKWETAL